MPTAAQYILYDTCQKIKDVIFTYNSLQKLSNFMFLCTKITMNVLESFAL